MEINPINIAKKFDTFNDIWSPKIIEDLNGQHVKLARLKGDFVRHQHMHEDELFFVIEGVLEIELDDKTITLNAGEMVVIPKGVYHKPIARSEVKVLLFEPKSTLNTGGTKSELTQDNLERI